MTLKKNKMIQFFEEMIEEYKGNHAIKQIVINLGNA